MQKSGVLVAVGQDVHLIRERHVRRLSSGTGKLSREDEVLPGRFGHIVTFTVLWQGIDQRISDLVLRSSHGLDDSCFPNVHAGWTSGRRIQGQHSDNG